MEDYSLESVISNNIRFYLKEINTCAVAIVVGTERLKDGFVTVKPLVNKIHNDLTSVEQPNIAYVPVLMPRTSTSGIVMPINQGDTVLLLFCKDDVDEVKFGSKEPSEPRTLRQFDYSDAVALVGFNIAQESIWNSSNHYNGYDNKSLKVVHNLGKDTESFLELNDKGGLNVKVTEYNVECNNFNVTATEKVSITAPLISENGV